MDPKHLTHLVTRARVGDLDAFATLVRWIEPRLRAYVARLVGARPIVDDVLQETSLRPWRGLAAGADFLSVVGGYTLIALGLILLAVHVDRALLRAVQAAPRG